MHYDFLVVDDTSFMRKMATDCLNQYGHKVLGEAVNGREAVQKFKDLQPHVVMMDLTMPEMNGVEAIREILKVDAEAVILVCSASNQKDMIQEALDAGAVGYLMKPFKPEYMNEIIKKYAVPHLKLEEPAEEIEEIEEVESVEVNENDEEVEEVEEKDNVVLEVAATVETVDEAPVTEHVVPRPEEYKATPERVTPEYNSEPKAPKMNRENRFKFKTSYMCNWEEDVQGETKNFAFTYTENDQNICLEMSDGTNDVQSIKLSLDGFRELHDWLEQRLEEGNNLR